MAVLYITEYADVLTSVNSQPVPIVLEPALAAQTVAIGGSSVQSSALNSKTKIVRVQTDAICSITFGTNPTATSSNRRLSADQTEYFGVPANSSYKVAVITNT